jgi:hypothetical protein
MFRLHILTFCGLRGIYFLTLNKTGFLSSLYPALRSILYFLRRCRTMSSQNNLDWASSTDTSEGHQKLWQNTHSDAVARSPTGAMYHSPDQLDARYTSCDSQKTVEDNWFSYPLLDAEDCKSITSPDFSVHEARAQSLPLDHFYITMDQDLVVDFDQVSSNSVLALFQHFVAVLIFFFRRLLAIFPDCNEHRYCRSLVPNLHQVW